MSLCTLARYGVVAVAAVALPTGCGGGTTPSAGRSTDPHMIAMTNRFGYGAGAASQPRQILDSAGCRQAMAALRLRRSSGTIDIYNYRVKTGKLYGQITGFSFPVRLSASTPAVTCTSSTTIPRKSTSSRTAAHRRSRPRPTTTASQSAARSIRPPATSPSPTSTSLASGAGGLDVFAGGLSGSQTNYTNSNLYHLFPPGYDPKGNLFVQATDYSGNKHFAELPAGSSNFTHVDGSDDRVSRKRRLGRSLPRRHRSELSVLLHDDDLSRHRFRLEGHDRAHDALTDNCYPYHNYMVAVQPFVSGTTRKGNAVVAGNLNCPSAFGFWNYTNGGNPKRNSSVIDRPSESLRSGRQPAVERYIIVLASGLRAALHEAASADSDLECAGLGAFLSRWRRRFARSPNGVTRSSATTSISVSSPR